ncbi:MAG TPA: TetR family transcriptional regulator [Candidatus Tenderia sp.]|nr:TetR family transcriptional regulator [Candidatus Tenderia sp.]
MEHTALDDIAVKALCEQADVSEATFFNYFGKKSELLDYFIQLWNLELTWHHHHTEAQGLDLLAASFTQVAQQFQKHPGVMAEIISHQTQQRSKPELPDIGRAERLQAFPKLANIETQEIEGLDRMWAHALQQAIDQGELPANTHLPTTIIGLATIFYGVPLALGQKKLAAIASIYRQQINIYLAGIKAASRH